MTPPVLTTDRLILRGPQLGDFDASAAYLASPRSTATGGPCARHIAWQKFSAQAGAWMLRGYGMWMIEEKSSQTVVGRTGIFYPDGWLEPELGWVMFENGEGKGYAYEAAIAARSFAYQSFNMSTLISTIGADNSRSIAFATRLGATYEGDWTSPYGILAVYRHPAAETR